MVVDQRFCSSMELQHAQCFSKDQAIPTRAYKPDDGTKIFKKFFLAFQFSCLAKIWATAPKSCTTGTMRRQWPCPAGTAGRSTGCSEGVHRVKALLNAKSQEFNGSDFFFFRTEHSKILFSPAVWRTKSLQCLCVLA